MARILLLDDEPRILSAMTRVLRVGGKHDIEDFSLPSAALQRAREVEFDLVIADYRMPEMDGACFLQEFRQLQPDAYRIIISGYADRNVLSAAINRAQLHRFLEKPVDNMVLLHAVTEGLTQGGLHREMRRLRAELEQTRKTLKARTGLLRTVAERCPDVLPEDWEQGSGR